MSTAFAEQNEQFVTGVDGDLVKWGYQGQRTADMTDITRADVRWFYRLAGQLTDEQMRRASSPAARPTKRIFTAALRGRSKSCAKSPRDDWGQTPQFALHAISGTSDTKQRRLSSQGAR